MTIRIKSRQQNFPDNDYFIRHYYEFFNFNYKESNIQRRSIFVPFMRDRCALHSSVTPTHIVLLTMGMYTKQVPFIFCSNRKLSSVGVSVLHECSCKCN